MKYEQQQQQKLIEMTISFVFCGFKIDFVHYIPIDEYHDCCCYLIFLFVSMIKVTHHSNNFEE